MTLSVVEGPHQMKNVARIVAYGSLGLLFLLTAGLVSQVRPLKSPQVTIGLVTFDVEVADEPAEWRKGLVGHERLAQGEGMLFVFPGPSTRTFWMKDMTFPIDIIWIRGNQVVGYADNAQPDDGEILYYSPGPVDNVLEVAAGERIRLGIVINSSVSVE